MRVLREEAVKGTKFGRFDTYLCKDLILNERSSISFEGDLPLPLVIRCEVWILVEAGHEVFKNRVWIRVLFRKKPPPGPIIMEMEQ